MKIIKFHAENVKGIKVADISPQDNTVVISGDNGAGKSSVLDAILWALCGMKTADVKPIRDGEEKAVIRLDIGQKEIEYIIERKIGKTNALTIKTPEGATFNSPQDMLDALVGKIAFDPLAFRALPPKEQFKEVRKLADFDFDALDAQNKADYDERTNVNRDVKQLEAQARAIILPEIVPDALVDVSEKSKVLIDASERRERASSHYRMFQAAQAQLAEAEARIEAAKEKRDTYEREYNDLRQGVISKEEIAELQEEIQNAETLNNTYRLKQENTKLCQALQAKIGESQALTQAMERREKEKQAAIESIDFGSLGLALVGGEITLDNVPLSQCSSGESLKVCTFIAMMLNPALRVIRIRDGALLDASSMDWMRRIAKGKDYQIWIERVGAEPMSIVMQDGQILETGEENAVNG